LFLIDGDKNSPKGIFNPLGPSYYIALENPFHAAPKRLKVRKLG
jgi:hypothetical protein